MKNSHITKLSLLVASSILLMGCDPEFSNPVGDTSSYSKGSADFSHYVAIGDSLTAGYADGTLYQTGQENSFPNILATQLKTVGGGTFRQPLMSDNLGGLSLGGSPMPASGSSQPGRTRLIFDASIKTPVPIEGTPSTELHPALNQNILSGTFNNMGVPGAKSFHLLAPGYGALSGIFDINSNTIVSPVTANPYFIRFATSDTASMLSDSVAQNPTFFTVWVGNNDVLAYATDGGYDSNNNTNAVDHNNNPLANPNNLFDPANLAAYNFSDITNNTIFAAYYTALITQLTTTAPDAKGILISIPDVNTVPYFTTVPYNAIPLDSATADQLNAGFNAAYNPGLDAALQSGSFPTLTQAEVNKRKISFSAGANAPVIDASEEVANGTLTDLSAAGIPAIRQATSSDLIVLTAASILGKENTGPTDVWGLSATSPLADKDVLIPSEIAAINNARAAYNSTIKSNADAHDNLAFFDASKFMADLHANGYDYGTGGITSAFVTGGAFSLDGVHPTARGYAIIANNIINTINSSFGANIPKVDPGTYTTVFLK